MLTKVHVAEGQLELVGYLNWLDGQRGALSLAEVLRDRSPTPAESAKQWDAFQKNIAVLHPNWQVSYIEQLHPIGVNPETGLWEFVDLKTGFLPRSFKESPDAYTGIVYVCRKKNVHCFCFCVKSSLTAVVILGEILSQN